MSVSPNQQIVPLITVDIRLKFLLDIGRKIVNYLSINLNYVDPE